MEVHVHHLSGVKFEAGARGHRIVCDQPADNRGTDAGMTPPELLLASLGTCAGFYAAEYLRVRHIAADGLDIRVTAEKVTAPVRLGSLRIEIALPNLDPVHEAGVLRAVKACLIHNTLMHAPAIEIALETRALATVS